MSDVLLGIDAGTSVIKVCAFRRDGRLVAKAQRPVPVVTPLPRWAEIDLERYWELVSEALREVVARCGPPAGIGLSTTCPTTVVLDAAGAPLRPGIVYLDGRADEVVHDVAGADAAAYLQRAGNRASPSTCWAANALWLQRHEPQLWARAERLCTLNGFLGLRLTGALGIDPTQASYSGLVDVREAVPRYKPALLKLWQVPKAMLPPLLDSAARLGTVTEAGAAHTGVPAGTPVALGAADTAAAAFALGLRAAGEAFESVGTSGVLTFCLDRPEFDAGFLNRYHVRPGRWLAHGAMSTLGGAFGWLQNKVWPELRSLPELERLAHDSPPGANGLVFLPYLAGERSPIWDTEASAAWIGLRLSHTRADMVRAVFEGAAFGLRQILERAQQRWGWRPRTLVGVGGGAHSAFWGQIKADVLALDYGMGDVTDASALGAAMMGGVAAGVYAGLDDPQLPLIAVGRQAVHPGPAERTALYDRHYRVFAGLYPLLADSMHALSPPAPPAVAARAPAAAKAPALHIVKAP
jgi:xylulokinase